MLDLKSIYLYFLSAKKITTKTIRRFFFSTTFYNKRLLTESPSRFFFYPNPYLKNAKTIFQNCALKPIISLTRIGNIRQEYDMTYQMIEPQKRELAFYSITNALTYHLRLSGVLQIRAVRLL